MDKLSRREKEKRTALARKASSLPVNQRLTIAKACLDLQNGIFRKSHQTEKWTYQDAIEVIDLLSAYLK